MREKRKTFFSILWSWFKDRCDPKIRSLSGVILGFVLIQMLWGVLLSGSVRAGDVDPGVWGDASTALSEIPTTSLLAADGSLTQTLFLPILSRSFPLPIFFLDRFDTERGWEPVVEEGTISGTVGGEYALGHENSLHIGRSIAPPCSESDDPCADPLPTSYWVSVEGRLTTKDQEVNQFGILFNYVSNSEYYLFLVEPNPNQPIFRVFRSNPDNPSEFHLQLASGGSSAIRTGTASNELMVKREGNRIRVYANSVLLADITDSTYSGGRLGLDVWVINAPGEARFDNFTIYELP